MTYSPIISAAGTVPDSAAAADPAGAADPAAPVPEPAGAPDPGISTGQPAEPGTQASRAGSATGQADSPASADSAAGQADSASGQADSASGQADSASGQADSASGQADSASGQADSASGQADSASGQADSASGYGGHGGHSADQGAYSAGYADTATDAADSGRADEADSGRADEAAWPHQSFLELGALPTAAPCARLHATLVLWEWDLGTLVHTAGLVVSELVSNAVQASAGLTGSRFAGHWTPGIPPVRVWLSADDHRVVIQVWDGSDRPPVPQPVEPEADSGRGLLLVGALSAEWGCYTPEKSSGKVVWAVVTG